MGIVPWNIELCTKLQGMFCPNAATFSYSIGCCRISRFECCCLRADVLDYSTAVPLMMSLFPSKVHCFYCNQTLSSRPANPRAFQCPHCECWNRYHKNGGRSAEAKPTLNILLNPFCQEIMSDEPAMHEESLNRTSFAKRGECSTKE